MSTQTLFTSASPYAMRLRSGGTFDLAKPSSVDVHLSDIALGLSRICRFAGQPRRFYSVAEHCVHAVRHAQRLGLKLDLEKTALLHDAAEAYVGDVIRPLRRLLGGYATIEHGVTLAIFRRFGVTSYYVDDRKIRDIDDGLLRAEYAELFADHCEASAEFAATPFQFWAPEQAEREYLAMAAELGIED